MTKATNRPAGGWTSRLLRDSGRLQKCQNHYHKLALEITNDEPRSEELVVIHLAREI